MTFDKLTSILLNIPGGPKILVQEECPPYHKLGAIILNFHRQHNRHIEKLGWRNILPLGIKVKYRNRPHQWLRDKCGSDTIYLVPAYNNDENRYDHEML